MKPNHSVEPTRSCLRPPRAAYLKRWVSMFSYASKSPLDKEYSKGRLLANWMSALVFMFASSVLVSIGGCAPLAIVGGGAGIGMVHVIHCSGLGVANNCPTELPPEKRAAQNDDVETLRKSFDADPRLYKNPERLYGILFDALSSGSLDVIRFLIPKYADPKTYLSPKSGETLLGLAGSKCQSVSLLMDMGAAPRASSYYTGGFFRRVAQRAQGEDAPICLTAIKKIVAAGYQPTQEELDAAYLWAHEGWLGGDAVSKRTNKPNIEMSDYLRSLGAQYPSAVYKREWRESS